MKNNLTTFSFGENQVRSLMINDEPWFVAKDICGVLEYSDTSVSCSRLNEDDKTITNIKTNGGNQKLIIISKIGLYKLILSSRKDSVKPLVKTLLDSISNVDSILKALNDFEVPDDLPDMFVYAIRNTVTGNIKLGISKDPESRIKQLQIGNDCKLELIASRKADNRFADEAELHIFNASSNIHGEWFYGDKVCLESF